MPKPKPRDNSNSNSNNKRRHNAARRHNLDAIILVFPTLSSDTTHFIALLWQLLCHGLWPAAAGSGREVGGWGESLLLPSLVGMTIFMGQGNWLKVAKTLSHRRWNRIHQGAIYTYILTLRVQRFMLSGCLAVWRVCLKWCRKCLASINLIARRKVELELCLPVVVIKCFMALCSSHKIKETPHQSWKCNLS